jgi:hypothetical protein
MLTGASTNTEFQMRDLPDLPNSPDEHSELAGREPPGRHPVSLQVLRGRLQRRTRQGSHTGSPGLLHFSWGRLSRRRLLQQVRIISLLLFAFSFYRK